MSTKPRLVSLTEIPPLTGLALETIRGYRRRGLLPAPDYELATGPVWLAETIELWNVTRRRERGPRQETVARIRAERQRHLQEESP